MNPALDTVVRSSPRVWNAYPEARKQPIAIPPTSARRSSVRSRGRENGASTPHAIANRTARKRNSG